MKRDIFLSCCLFLFVFSFLPSTYAIGISPPSVTLDYVPGKTYAIDARLINYNDFPIGVDVRKEGEYTSAISVDEPIKINALDSTPVLIQVTMPNDLRPGMNTNTVYFKENFTSAAAGSFAVRTEVGMLIKIWEPYPGEYAEITSSVNSVSEGQKATLNTQINNLGTSPITDGVATVKIYDSANTLVDSFTFGVKMDGNSHTSFTETVASDSYRPGKYTVKSELKFGNQTATHESSFFIGTLDIAIRSITGPFYLDKPVNRFTVSVESLWNLPVDGVYATLELGSGKATTPTEGVGSFGKLDLSGYWETDPTVQTGEPLAHVTIYFANTSEDALLPIPVFNETPKTAPEVQEPSIELSLADLLFIALSCIIVAGIVIFAITRHLRRDPPYEPPKPGKPGIQ